MAMTNSVTRPLLHLGSDPVLTRIDFILVPLCWEGVAVNSHFKLTDLQNKPAELQQLATILLEAN